MLAAGLLLASTPEAAEPPRPNVIFILADDLGYGDLGSYGATDIATPHIDRLAAEGIRFTDFYAPANTCSPSRAALLTGRYPFRTGVNAVLFHDAPAGLPHAEVTSAEVLRDAGYRTALIGKWHLGPSDAFMPWTQGFETFFGVPHSNDQKNFFLYDGRERLPGPVDQSTLMRRYTDRALAFVRAADGRQPFFLLLAPNTPHIPLHPSPAFAGRSRRDTYGDMVEELDAAVGEILTELARLGLDRNTLVVFTSDNGPWLAMRDWGGDAGGLREGKTTVFEGGHRVPLLARWPARIPAGRTATAVANGMDWFPTLAELAGARVPDDREVDGRTLAPVLAGTGEREPALFFYLRLRMPFAGDQAFEIGAVRDGRWKLVLPQRGFYPHLLEPLMKAGLYWHGEMLFDLEQDRAEQHDVGGEHPEVAERLRAGIDAFRAAAAPAPPVLVRAAAEDHRGWERLWRGVAAGMLVMALVPIVAAVVVVWAVRRALRRRRRAGRAAAGA